MDESVIRNFGHLTQPAGDTITAQKPAEVKVRLSQAIRIGAKLRPQCFGEFRLDGGSCALGAAEDAGFPISHLPNFLWEAILHRNDTLRQTREQIADWLEAQGY